MKARRLDRRASKTAETNALQRAAETLRPAEERLLYDPYAKHFVTHPLYRVALANPLVARGLLGAVDRFFAGLHGYLMLRVRYADEAIGASVGEGIDQLVLLGAGFDSTALRADGRPLTIYEVDAPPTQRAKRESLERAGLVPIHRVAWVPCDFERDNMRERLAAAGFDSSRRSLVVWLGVTPYLTSTAFHATLGDLSALCAPGSRLVVDYGDPGIVDGKTPWPGARRVSRYVARRGEPYRLGLTQDQLRKTLVEHGFELRDDARLPDLAIRFAGRGGTWCSTDDWLGVATADRVSSS